MRRECLFAAVGLTAALSFGDTPVEIKNAGFESIGPNGEAVGWIMPKRYWKAVPGVGSNGSGGLVFEGDDPKSRDWPHQWITVKEGKRYRLSANLRPDGLTCPSMGRWSGLSIYIEWYDATGKLTGCTMTYCANGKSDWVHRETVTPVVKPGVAKCRIIPLVVNGGVGRAVIDDISLVEIEERPVDGVWSSAYRDEAADGRVTFAAGLHLGDGAKTNDLRTVFSFAGADGRRRTRAGTLSADAARFETDVAALAFGTNEVVCTLYEGERALGSDRMRFARVKALTPRRVRFDAQRRLLVDGKPFLPIGVYCLEIDRPNLDILADSPFNCLMSYKFPTSDAELDLCQEKGLKVLYDVRCKTDSIHDDEIGCSWLKRRIPEVRKHPAVLAWYSDDESPLTLVPRLKGRYRLLAELDPDHPVWAVQDKTDLQLRDYLGTFDVVGTDPYPVSRYPIGNVTKALRNGRRATFALKPVWQVPQAFTWNESGRENERTPTAQEIANMTWQSIAGGANGLVYFRYFQLRERERTGGATWWRETWPAVCAAARDVKRFERVILGEPGPSVSGAPADLAVRTWRAEDADWFLFVNATTNRLSCDVALADASGAWKTELGLAASVKPVARGLSLDLQPLAVTLAVRTGGGRIAPRPVDEDWWRARHRQKLEEIKAGDGRYDIVFFGDSISHYWEFADKGASVLADLRKDHTALVLGYGGDRTYHALWRARNGELDGYRAGLVVVLIGCNNWQENSATEIAADIRELVGVIRRKQPQAKVLLMPLLPRAEKMKSAKNRAVSQLIESIPDGRDVLWLDIRKPFEGAPADLLPDGLHPSEKGYEIWLDALRPYLTSLSRMAEARADF